MNKLEKTRDKARIVTDGFTLIELLVVISIIALLSTIVLATIQDVRTRAQNAKLNEIALQYINAFELAKTSNIDVPIPTVMTCLGYGPNGCVDSVTEIKGSTTIDNILDDFYPSMPKNEDFKVNGASGVLYYKDNINGPYMSWHLKGDVKCPRAAVLSGAGPNTMCKFYINK